MAILQTTTNSALLLTLSPSTVSSLWEACAEAAKDEEVAETFGKSGEFLGMVHAHASTPPESLKRGSRTHLAILLIVSETAKTAEGAYVTVVCLNQFLAASRSLTRSLTHAYAPPQRVLARETVPQGGSRRAVRLPRESYQL